VNDQKTFEDISMRKSKKHAKSPDEKVYKLSELEEGSPEWKEAQAILEEFSNLWENMEVTKITKF
jgi:hypothetical protein